MSFGRELVAVLIKPSMFGELHVHVLEVVWRFEPKNILYQFIEGQTQFSTACVAKNESDPR